MRIAFALFVLTFLPGIPLAGLFFRNLRQGIAWLSIAGTVGLLWSSVVTLLLTTLHLPSTPLLIVLVHLLPGGVLFARRQSRETILRALRDLSFSRAHLLVPVIIAVVMGIFLAAQTGLPTGDVQKAIFWGERVLVTGQLPNYADAERFNRDPADFATPALHTMTAAAMRLTGDALRGPTWLAFLSGVFLAGIASAIATILAPRYQSVLPPLAFVLAVANARALRYTVAPGYHYQNLLGELFLLLGLFALLHAVGGRGHQRSVTIAGIAVGILPFMHQFSAFLAALTMPVILLLLVVKYRGEIAAIVLNRSPRMHAVLIGAGVSLGVMSLFAVHRASLFSNIATRLISTTPHLRDTLIPLTQIPELLGIPFTLLGVAGVLLVIISMRRQELEWRWIVLLVWSALLLAISQGPAWLLDTPSARTLFTLAVPLAIFAALAIVRATERIRMLWPQSAPLLIPSALALLLAPIVGVPLNAAFHGSDSPTSGTAVLTDHRHHHNATLTPAMLVMLDFLEKNPPACNDEVTGQGPQAGGNDDYAPCPNAVLVDDWNYRRGTWAILSPYRMLTRVGADISIHAGEAAQSAQRRTQYEALLDFERIVENGSLPTIQPLLQKQG
ncbi:MAG: hypothetical protein G01um1014106_601, partial [Parcubacteria group bacterium Gr01-1014_106]